MKRTGDSIFNRTMKKKLREKQSEDTKIVNTDDDNRTKEGSEKLHDNVSKVSFLASIKFKLIASFVIPIMFIILIGSLSFLKASEVIESNCEKAAQDTMNMASQCLEFGFQSVQTTAKLYANDSLIQRYSLNCDDKANAYAYRDNIAEMLDFNKAADDFIRNIYFVNENVDSISTGVGIDSGVYKSFKETDLGKILDNNKTENIWDGQDEFLDKQFQISPDDYTMRLIRNISNFDAFLIVDVDADVAKNILNELKIDKTGFLGLVTLDGKEIIDDSLKQENPSSEKKSLQPEKIFVNQTFYKEAMEGKEVSGSKYVDYKGNTYLFVYSKVSDTGAAFCALMPKSIITSQTDSIKSVIFIIVVIAILVLFIVTMLSSGIHRTSKNIIREKW